MADLVTHTCVALLFKAASRGPRVAVFVAGTCLPDLLARVPAMVLTEARWTMPAIPEWLVYLWVPLHMPMGILLASVFFAFLLPERGRAEGFRALLGGGALHLAVDVLQSHFGVGYLLLFPFSQWDFELGWIGSEDTVRIVPVLAPVTAVVAWWRWGREWRARRAERGAGSP